MKKKTVADQNPPQDTASGSQNTPSSAKGSRQPSPAQAAAPKSANVSPTSQPAAKKATGPRTAAGKQRSKLNALKHGLFTKVILLQHESRAEYKALHDGMRQDLKPQGLLESLIVENLAGLWWRRRRLIQAETAEIARKEFSVLEAVADLQIQQLDYAQTPGASVAQPGGNGQIAAVWEAINCLRKWRIAILDNADGLKEARTLRIRKLMFGQEEERPGDDRVLREFLSFLLLIPAAKAPAANDPEKWQELYQKAINKKIQQLMKLLTALQQTQVAKAQFCGSLVPIPPQRVADQLIRYESHFSRETSRLMTELERLQRIRRGQPVPPTIKLEVN